METVMHPYDMDDFGLEDHFASLVTSDDDDGDGREMHSCPKKTRSDQVSDGHKQRPQSKGASRKRARRRKRMLTGVSKQRRAANERERKRLQIINSAFKDLKHILPLMSGEENISKIEIVRLAATTIRHLSQILNEEDTMSSGTGDDSSSSARLTDNGSSGSSVTSLEDNRDNDTFSLFETADGETSLGDVDLSFLLFSTEDAHLDSVDSGLEIPSPTISETSSHDQLSFPFMEQDMIDDDDVFCHGPTMIMW